MKNLKKKGFTIVELVIVIAVIAVLAAVLIPTFVNLTRKANMSSDQVAVRNMNTLLATEFAAEKPTELKQVIDMLDKNGYNVDALTPLSKGYAFVWNQAENKIELVEISAVGEAPKLEEGSSFINKEVNTKEELVSALENGNDVTLTADLTSPITSAIKVIGDITIDTNGFKITTSTTLGRPFDLTEGSKLTINAGKSEISCGKWGLVNIPEDTKNATLVLNGGIYTATTENGSFIKVRKGNEKINITLNDVTYVDDGTGYLLDTTYKLDDENYPFGGNLNLTINGGSFESNYGFNLNDGEYNIKNASIETEKQTMIVQANAIVNIDKCVINQTTNDFYGVVCVGKEGQLNISNSTLTGAEYAYAVLNTGGTLVANNNTIINSKEYYIYTLDSGKTAFVTIDGVKKQ